MKFIVMVCVLRAGEPRLDHREACLHEHHEESGDERPHEVDRDGIRRGGGVRGVREGIRRRDSLCREGYRA
jgi:hypothetical protein